MARNVVGLDIGTTAVRAAEVSARRGEIVLKRLGQVALPAGVVVDGEVTEPEAAAGAIRALWRRVRIGSKRVVLGVANQRVVVRLVDLPWMQPAELQRSLAYQAQEYLPIPVDEAELDYNVLAEHGGDEHDGNAGQRLLRVLVVAGHKEMLAGHLRAVALAGLQPVGIDLNAFALVRSLAPVAAVAEEGAEALIDVGARVTNVVVHQNSVPRFVRILLMGGQDVTEGVSRLLGVDQETAEQAKLAASAGGGDPATGKVVERQLAAFVEEVRGSLDFYRAQAGAVPLERVTVSGGGSLLGPLAEQLNAALQVPVERGRALASLRPGRLRLQAEQLAELEPVAAVPVGLALGAVS
ncbi:MAG TPA: type IV pilus assembly protein PilM [Actinomycetes bacterium]|nr:type IV pilus assembly protein PilM [Actinomycetes bacterium]